MCTYLEGISSVYLMYISLHGTLGLGSGTYQLFQKKRDSKWDANHCDIYVVFIPNVIVSPRELNLLSHEVHVDVHHYTPEEELFFGHQIMKFHSSCLRDVYDQTYSFSLWGPQIIHWNRELSWFWAGKNPHRPTEQVLLWSKERLAMMWHIHLNVTEEVCFLRWDRGIHMTYDLSICTFLVRTRGDNMHPHSISSYIPYYIPGTGRHCLDMLLCPPFTWSKDSPSTQVEKLRWLVNQWPMFMAYQWLPPGMFEIVPSINSDLQNQKVHHQVNNAWVIKSH